MACARQIKRIDSITKSPIYAFFSETLNGTSSIRAYGQQQRFISHSDMLLDNSQRVWFESFTSNRSTVCCSVSCYIFITDVKLLPVLSNELKNCHYIDDNWISTECIVSFDSVYKVPFSKKLLI